MGSIRSGSCSRILQCTRLRRLTERFQVIDILEWAKGFRTLDPPWQGCVLNAVRNSQNGETQSQCGRRGRVATWKKHRHASCSADRLEFESNRWPLFRVPWDRP